MRKPRTLGVSKVRCIISEACCKQLSGKQVYVDKMRHGDHASDTHTHTHMNENSGTGPTCFSALAAITSLSGVVKYQHGAAISIGRPHASKQCPKPGFCRCMTLLLFGSFFNPEHLTFWNLVKDERVSVLEICSESSSCCRFSLVRCSMWDMRPGRNP